MIFWRRAIVGLCLALALAGAASAQHLRNTATTVSVGLVDKAVGTAITAGTVTAFVTLDGGTQTAIAGTPVLEGNGDCSVPLTAGETNGAFVSLVVLHEDSQPTYYRFFTTATDVGAIKTKTDFLPSATAGAAGGLLIAGSNAPTTFATLTSTGDFTINGDPFSDIYVAINEAKADIASVQIDTTAILEDTGTTIPGTITTLQAGVNDVPTNAEFAARSLLQAEYATAANLATAVTQTTAANIRTAVGLASANLDTQLDGLEPGTSQSRINKRPAPGFTIQISRRADGTHKATRPIRLTPGAIDNVFVFIDMAPIFGPDDFVETVGTPSVEAGGSITASAEGPRDTYAVVELDGTATASEERTITVPVTMDSGTTINVVFDVSVFAE
jgi:hypothetical protein